MCFMNTKSDADWALIDCSRAAMQNSTRLHMYGVYIDNPADLLFCIDLLLCMVYGD